MSFATLGSKLKGRFRPDRARNLLASQKAAGQKGLGVREVATAARSYYVASTGSDTLNDGKSATYPFLTVQKAIDTIWNTIDWAGNAPSIVVADGTFSGAWTINGRPVGYAGAVAISGNSGAPANCVINVSGTAISVGVSAVVSISGFKIISTNIGVDANSGANVSLSAINWGACTGSHLGVGANTQVTQLGNYTISGDAGAHIHVIDGGQYTSDTGVVTFSGTRAFSNYFFGTSEAGSQAKFNNTFSGNATGRRAFIHQGASVETVSGPTHPDLYFPGDTASTWTSPSNYNDYFPILNYGAMAAHNAVVNPAVNVSQELGTTGATLASGAAKYTADCWEAQYVHGAGTAVVTSKQCPASSFDSAVGDLDFQFGHQIKATTAITSPANGDYALHRTKIEGYRVAQWAFGTAIARTFQYAFMFHSTAAGTALLKFSNSDHSRNYYIELTAAVGWNFFSGTVPGDSSGTWQKTTSIGLIAEFIVSGKEASPVGTLGAWTATDKKQSTNSGNLLGTNANNTIVTGLFLDLASQVPLQADLPMLMRPYPEELALCLRYFWRMKAANGNTIFAVGANDSTTASVFCIRHPAAGGMRVEPSAVTVSAAADFSVYEAGALTACATMSRQTNQGSPDNTRISTTVASGLTTGRAVQLFSSSTSAAMDFDARL